jgi:hypothetical protein
MCGTDWSVNGQKPLTINQITGRERMAVTEKSVSGKKGTCLNCERSKYIAGADGLCGTCHNAVKGLVYGTPEYTAALAAAKTRLTDQNHKRKMQDLKSFEKVEKTTEKIKATARGNRLTMGMARNHEYIKYLKECGEQGITPVSRLLYFKRENNKKKNIADQICGYSVLDDSVMKKITIMRDYHQSEADKLNKVIEILQA